MNVWVELKLEKSNKYFEPWFKANVKWEKLPDARYEYCGGDIYDKLIQALAVLGKPLVRSEKGAGYNKGITQFDVHANTKLGKELIRRLDTNLDVNTVEVCCTISNLRDLLDRKVNQIVFGYDVTTFYPLPTKLSEPVLRYCANDVIETSKLMSTFYDPTKVLTEPNADQSEPKRVIFNKPYTIVIWKDGTKTMVKCDEEDTYDKEKGLALCYVKKMFGNNGKYYDIFKKFIDE